MSNKIFFFPFIILTTTFLAFNFYSSSIIENPGYIGIKKCGVCHKKENAGQQLKIWEESKHSQAYKTLQTEEADKIATKQGFTTKAVETEQCLKCHATGYDVDASLLGDKFNIEDGVQCETCHGPGSEYKSKKVMKDRTLAIEKGLIIYEKSEELCIKCHNEESPSFKEFNFEERWAEIKHSIPNE
jgi:hypothetical protein